MPPLYRGEAPFVFLRGRFCLMTAPPRYVLLCEDDENDAFLFEIEWQKAGFRVPLRVMANGDNVLALLARCRDEGEVCPQLIISDHKLLAGGGMDILTRVRNTPLLAEIPVVLTSGVVNASIKAQAMALGAIDVWEKPATPADLLKLGESLPGLLA
jgi:CheY-like chemotaxis protein